MRGTILYSVVGAAVCVVASSPAAVAAEQGVIRARLELDRVAARLRSLRKIDARMAKRLLGQIQRANTYLKSCKKKGDADWIKQAKRSQALEKRIRGTGGAAKPAPKATPKPGQPKPPTTYSGTPDANTYKAKRALDRVEQDFKAMPKGDVPTAAKLVTEINRAVTMLNKSTRRTTKLWHECLAKARALDGKVRARAKEKGAAPVVKGEPRAFKPFPKLAFKYGKRNGAVDAIRRDLAKELAPRIEKLVEAGKIVEAKQLLWGLWAQQIGTRYDKESKARFQRARDAVYGPEPVMRTDDGLVEAETQITFARAAIKAGNLVTATRVKLHVEALVRAGLKLPAEQGKAFKAMVAEQNAAWEAGNAAVRTAAFELLKTGTERGNLSLEDRVYQLKNDQRWIGKISGKHLRGSRQNITLLRQYEASLKYVLEDFEAARKAFPKFAAAPFDPAFVDLYYAGAIKQDKKYRRNAVFLVGAIRAAVFGKQTLEGIGLPGLLLEIYRGVIERGFSEAEGHFQRDKPNAGKKELKAAGNWIAHAARFGLPEKEVAQLRTRAKELEASAGVGKLRRANQMLNKVAKWLKTATAKGSFEYCRKELTATKGWLERAKEGGVDPAALAKAEKRWADLSGPTFSGLLLKQADRFLKQAEGHIAEARKRLGNPGRAFDALHPVWKAGRRMSLATPFRSLMVVEASKTSVDGRIAKIKSDSAEINKNVEQIQRMPKDVFEGSASWRGTFKRMVARERGWKVYALSIVQKEWQKKTMTWDYPTSGNMRIHEKRWYKRLHGYVAVQNEKDPERVDLRYVGFQRVKMTDGSYRMLKLYYVADPYPMLKKNLP